MSRLFSPPASVRELTELSLANPDTQCYPATHDDTLPDSSRSRALAFDPAT